MSVEEERGDALAQWLVKHNARELWHKTEPKVPRRGPQQAVTCYAINGYCVVVVRYRRDGQDAGWDVFVPVTQSNDVAETLHEATHAISRERLPKEECCGSIPLFKEEVDRYCTRRRGHAGLCRFE